MSDNFTEELQELLKLGAQLVFTDNPVTYNGYVAQSMVGSLYQEPGTYYTVDFDATIHRAPAVIYETATNLREELNEAKFIALDLLVGTIGAFIMVADDFHNTEQSDRPDIGKVSMEFGLQQDGSVLLVVKSNFYEDVASRVYLFTKGDDVITPLSKRVH